MDKQQLLKLIEDLPDDVNIEPIEYLESSQKEYEWVSQHRSTDLGGVYRRNVDNTFNFTLRFRTTYEGEFRRTYENAAGTFFNVHRVK